MSKTTTEVRKGGVSLFGLLFVAFITLKLSGAVSWPWIWVLAPLWIPYALALGLVFTALLVVILGVLLS
jgi:hypothetical protein